MTSTFRAGTLVLGTALCLAWAPPPARAQDANRDAVYAKTEVADIVDRMQRRTGTFREEFDKAMAHSILDSSRMEEKAKHRADDLHDASRKLKDVFGNKKDKNDPRVREQVDKTLSAASDVNRVMVEFRFTEKLQRDWDLLRSDLNGLAAVYSLPAM